MKLEKIIEREKKLFRKKFVEPASGVRAIDTNNNQYIIGRADGVEQFLDQSIRRAVRESLKILELKNWDKLKTKSRKELVATLPSRTPWGIYSLFKEELSKLHKNFLEEK